MQRVYVAIIEKGEEGYGVFFPDLPGCTSYGETVGDAAANAVVAAQGHVALMAEDGDDIPQARKIEDIEQDQEVVEAARVMVPVEVDDERQRVNITLQASVLAALDAMASARGLDRSATIAELVRQTLAGDERNRAVHNSRLLISGSNKEFREYEYVENVLIPKAKSKNPSASTAGRYVYLIDESGNSERLQINPIIERTASGRIVRDVGTITGKHHAKKPSQGHGPRRDK